MNQSYLIDYIRTPIGNFGGALAPVRPDDLSAHTIKTLLERNSSLPQEQIEDVILGNANGAGEENRNVARMSLLLAGMPWSVPGETINRLCSSGLGAVVNADRGIKLGEGGAMVAGGVESMSRAPFVVAKSPTAWSRNAEIYDTSIGWRFVNPKLHERYGTDPMGVTAENLVEKYGISREEQDKFAFNSQMKAKAAMESGRLAKEIIPVSIPQRKGDDVIVDTDEFPRPNTTIETLAKLRAAFKKDGSVTAGNSSGVNDGAASLLLASKEYCEEYGLKPKARIISTAVAGVEPRIMGIGPVEAVNKALKRAKLSLSDIDIIELNEAFAAQSLACLREWNIDPEDKRLNPNGGAIALGHPLGMTGARLTGTAMLELELQDKEFAVVTMCVGVGQGYAAVIERM
ncbi:MAG: 3-oxoadipyl-CoA thiolase [Candidatus Kapaibacteriales bacterium]